MRIAAIVMSYFMVTCLGATTTVRAECALCTQIRAMQITDPWEGLRFEHDKHRLWYRPKKSLHASEQDQPDVARRRARWKRHQGKLDPARLVFIDET